MRQAGKDELKKKRLCSLSTLSVYLRSLNTEFHQRPLTSPSQWNKCRGLADYRCQYIPPSYAPTIPPTQAPPASPAAQPAPTQLPAAHHLHPLYKLAKKVKSNKQSHLDASQFQQYQAPDLSCHAVLDALHAYPDTIGNWLAKMTLMLRIWILDFLSNMVMLLQTPSVILITTQHNHSSKLNLGKTGLNGNVRTSRHMAHSTTPAEQKYYTL